MLTTSSSLNSGYYRTKSHVDGSHGAVKRHFTPDGVSSSQTAATVAWRDPDNSPTSARQPACPYLPLYGHRHQRHRFVGEHHPSRVSGFKGTMGGWDYDTAVNYPALRRPTPRSR